MALGTVTVVSWSVHYFETVQVHAEMSTTTDIRGPQRMNPKDVVDALTFSQQLLDGLPCDRADIHFTHHD